MVNSVAIAFSFACLSEALVPSVQNLRPVVPGKIYRSATLDNLSIDDAKLLLSGKAFNNERPLAAVIDLRNRDEIEKGVLERTEGSNLFYASTDSCAFIHIPLLEDTDAFWEEAIRRMSAKDRLIATIRSAFQGGALDRAAARNFEKGGHAMLNTIIMTVARDRFGEALQACLEESERGPVIFHCQKGKDRTGVLGMLIQSILDSSIENDEAIVAAYAMSGECLGEAERDYSKQDNINDRSNGIIDWSHFRGSPRKGMIDTLEWTRNNFGSVENYLRQLAKFDAAECAVFKRELAGHEFQEVGK